MSVIFYDKVFEEELNKIPDQERRATLLSDSIAARIETIMMKKGVSKKTLAALTHKKQCEVTRWLGGNHNFTIKTLVLIQDALGEDLIRVPKK